MRPGLAPMILAALVVVAGILIVARTIALGVGGGLGLLIGALFILGGGMRLYVGMATWRNR